MASLQDHRSNTRSSPKLLILAPLNRLDPMVSLIIAEEEYNYSD
jgi:hypothetical protein